MILLLRLLWCRRMHRESWWLYGGLSRTFIHCEQCGDSWGDRQTWRTSTGVPYAEASMDLQDRAVMNFGVRPDRRQA